MIISSDDRSPAYFGYVARKHRLSPAVNPYPKDSQARKDWEAGYYSGKLEQPKIKESEDDNVHKRKSS